VDTDPAWSELNLERATVTTSVNHLDATSPAERAILRTALQALIDLLFDLYAVLPPTGPAPAGLEHDGLMVFPPAYLDRYDRPFVRRAIVAAASLGQKLAGHGWFDLSSRLEEIVFGTIMESVQNTDIEIGDVFDDLEDSAFQNLDYELLFNAQTPATENITAWFEPLPDASFLNYYFDDPRVLTEPVEHRLYDPNAPEGALEYGIDDGTGDQ
jgi:hypothetical protein